MKSLCATRAGEQGDFATLPTVLVLDDDPHLLAKLRPVLLQHRFDVVCAQTIKAATAAAASGAIAVALIDYRLRGRASGLEFGAGILREHRIPFVMISGYLTTELTVLAMRSGASDVVDKPFDANRLVESLRVAMSPIAVPRVDTAESAVHLANASASDESITARWASLVLSACEAKGDPKTVKLFARAARVSTPVFRSVCSLCSVKAHDACNLGRFLRAIARARRDRSTLLSHLAIGDRRTAMRLFQTAGIALTARSVPLQDFVRSQDFIATSRECLHELVHRAANSSLFASDDGTGE
jgi:FixJ family two-component response regulator